MFHWLILTLAIVAEIVGTLSMKWASLSGSALGHLAMYLLIAGSYLLLAIAIKRIALGVAYALWEGAGLFCITLCSAIWFGEALTPMKIAGLLALAGGVLLVKSGVEPAKARKRSLREPRHVIA